MNDDVRIAQQLMFLHGKLRRATAEAVRDAIKSEIDHLLAALTRKQNAADPQLPPDTNAPEHKRG